MCGGLRGCVLAMSVSGDKGCITSDERVKEAEVYISQKTLLVLAKCKYINL